jgi:glutamate synthase (NADPH/NADH) small chain
VPGAAGRLAPRERPGSEFQVPADLVLLAMGFAGPRRSRLLEDLGVRFDARGNVVKDADCMTSIPGVFAAGDLARGASLVVRAMQDGRAAAEGIHRWLTASGGAAA